MENTFEIELAVKKIQEKNLAEIVRHYKGFIIIAQSESDYKSKVNHINRGDVLGFYTVEKVFNL